MWSGFILPRGTHWSMLGWPVGLEPTSIRFTAGRISPLIVTATASSLAGNLGTHRLSCERRVVRPADSVFSRPFKGTFSGGLYNGGRLRHPVG